MGISLNSATKKTIEKEIKALNAIVESPDYSSAAKDEAASYAMALLWVTGMMSKPTASIR